MEGVVVVPCNLRRMGEALDALDRLIVRELVEDGRRTIRDIARDVGASEPTVRSRVRRMQDEGILKIMAYVEPSRLGMNRLTFVMLKVHPDRHEDVVALLEDWDEVTYVASTLGHCDIIIEVSTSDDDELWRFLRKKLAGTPGVNIVETMTMVQLHKLRYAPRIADLPGSEP
jgi:Lrp/AsnC family transcriptional regulator, regulator for asnA, asnC and gidA